ncbi:RHS repeat protein [Streptomyces sp. ISL-66]|uniref:putative T7SS-secreted protein n=1 Tax=Streptomyces sp. ISL-66 TaxID=2819186 RepID=UPI001BEC5062|nr:RHS repeat-associated core domain-containing protein [Streptomyces sp. ISL-66]MBT2467303.1 RHS repeat protein [Streptomyces sp. ISL-66]
MGWRDFVPDVIEDGVEKGAEKVGDAVEWAGDKTADLAEDVGLDDAGDWIRDKSRSAANQLGADVAELELGQTEDPNKLVYGSVSKIRAQVSHLNDFKSSFDKVGNGLKGMGEPDGLKGETANSFRESVAKEPPRWFKAAEAFGKAADAMGRFAETVEWAQGQAKEALEEYNRAKKVSTEARDAHNQLVDTYNDALKAKKDPLPPRPSEKFTDPGTAIATAAQDKLDTARKQRNDVAESVRTAVRAARDAAPPKPSYAKQLGDGMDYMDLAKTHLAGGVIKGTAGIVNFARALNLVDPYNLTHPAEYVTNLNSTAAGLVTMANDPLGAGKQMLDEFMKDPSEGIGKMIPELVGSKGLGSLKKIGSAAKHADDLEGAARRTTQHGDGPGEARRTPDGDRSTAGDPVDLASGRMFLPQTDLELPGILPLVFTRRFESGCTVGRFMGPSWTCTVDERLEIDAAGVIHVTPEGLLIPYAHPAPGVPTRPEKGRGRTLLARGADGEYTVTEPASGLVFHFAAPAGSEPGGDGTAWLCEISERNGHRVTVDRDEDGLPSALVHSAGHRLNLSVTDGLVTALSLAGAGEGGTDLPLMGYGYEDGNLTAAVKPSGATTSFAYDGDRRITAWTDSNASRYDYVYDDRDRVVREGGEAGHVQIRLAYTDPDPRMGHHTTTVTTPDGHATHHLFGPGYKLLAVTDPLGHTTRFTYDARGNQLSLTDPLGLTTTFGYDEEDRVVRAVRPDGSELHTVRGRFGLPVEVVGPDGARMLHEYDERGNRTAVTDPVGATTRYTYDHAARLTSLTDAEGATTRVMCDAAGLPVEVTEPDGAVTRTERDALGRPVRITDPMGGVTRLEWDADGQLARRTGPDGATETWTYDGEGSLLSRTDAAGGVTRFEYTHFDLPVARIGSDGARYEFEHDSALRLTRVTDPQGLTWTYTYDAAGNVVSESDFDGRTLTYHVDAAGRLAARVDALGGTISFERDQLGQVTSKDVDGEVTAYAYDRAGRLLEATGPAGELRYQYDRRGFTKTELVEGRPISYAYDAVGRRTRRTTPTGHATSYTYGADGQPHRLTTGGRLVEFTHDAAGRELARVFGDAITVTSAWDEAGRLSEQHVTAAGRVVNSRAYAYRADGHLTSVADRLSGARTFDLDPAGRVTAVHAQSWTERYAYDTAGNQTSASWPSGHPGGEATGPRTYAGTSLTRAGNVRFEYDALGRVILRQKTRLSRKPDSWRYTWDSENRLTSVTTPDGTRWRYRYDPLGRRTAKQRLAADGEGVVEEVRFTWDGLTLCEQTTHQPDRPNTVALTWDHRGDVPLVQTERILTADDRQEEIDRRFFAIATDLIGTPTELIDEAGDIAWRSRATLWGTTAWARDSSTYTPLRFPGQYYDPETGLHYNYFRHYDPATGRYISPDPLGLAPAPNPVAYVANPNTGCDPLGLMPKYTKEEKAQKAKDVALKAIDDVIERAQEGAMKKAGNYHAHDHGFSEDMVVKILRNPDAVYYSTAGTGKLIFRQGEDIVVVRADNIAPGNVITAYGSSGIKGPSGFEALGGSPSDPGAPITHTDVVEGKIPAKNGYMAPAEQVR